MEIISSGEEEKIQLKNEGHCFQKTKTKEFDV